MTIPHRTAIVVGASSGIGAACVQELVRRGYTVAAVARRIDALEALRAACDAPDRVRIHAHDVTDFDDVPSLFRRIVDDLSGLGMIIYAAGAMPRIDPDTWDFAKDRLVLDTNLLGCVAWLDEAAPRLRDQGAGAIVGISSIAGDRGRRGYPAYTTSKAAMNTFLEALRNRLSRHGVTVTTIKPGYVDTVMTQGMKGLFWVASTEQAAQAIVSAAERGVHTRYVLRRWALVGFVIRSIPSFIFRKMDI
jgi:NAD(P)-dependent dehydrogenase (short-subunit alcohol dehydrogenase family)